MKRDGNNKSFWQTTDSQNFSTDLIDVTFDTIVVGAGITGITLVKELQNRGIKCLLLDKENPGFGTTGGTTAHINNFYDASYDEIINSFGEDAAQLLVKSTDDTLNYIKTNISRYGINCEYNACDFFLFSAEQGQNEQLDKIRAAHQQLGIKTTESNTLPFSLPFEKAIRIEGQGQFHPLKYIEGLLEAFCQDGGTVLLNQPIHDYTNKDGMVTVKTTDSGILSAKNIIWATHVPPGENRFGLLVAPYRSYALTVQLSQAPKMLAQTADLYDPYHYFRYHRSEDKYYLIAGGFDHKTG
ncbi:MAG: puuB 1, partial [Massilibacillus sp.]|nr:puuB 1 [Massilibacillus sp.]